MTDYINVDEIDKNQREVMLFVDFWVREKKTPVPQKEIVAIMLTKKVPMPTTIYSIQILLKKEYIRRAITISNKRSYVQLRRVNGS